MRCLHALLIVIAACGRVDFDPRTDAAPPAGGTRLHLQVNVFDDGARQIIGAYDTLLQVPCTPLPVATPDGFACLPVGASVDFADAACSQPIMQVPVSACGPVDVRYAYDPFTFPVTHIYAPGADIATPAMAYRRGADGMCVASSMPTGAYKALVEIPFDTFVSMTRELGAGTRVRSQTYVAHDGFRLPAEVYDTQANGPCIAVPFDDATVCETYSLGVAYHYTDAACTHLVFMSNVAVDFAEELVNLPACKSTDINLHAAIGVITQDPLWVEIPGSGTCVQTAQPAGWVTEDLGPPIPHAPLTRTPVPAGGSRIQLIEDASGEATGAEVYMFDSQLGIECWPTTSADGVTRCLPRTTSGLQHDFSDAGCTQPLSLALYGPMTCARPLPPLYISDFEGSGCTTREHIYRPGPKFSGTAYTGTPSQCNVLSTTADLYQIGSEIDPTTFTAVTTQIDP